MSRSRASSQKIRQLWVGSRKLEQDARISSIFTASHHANEGLLSRSSQFIGGGRSSKLLSHVCSSRVGNRHANSPSTSSLIGNVFCSMNKSEQLLNSLSGSQSLQPIMITTHQQSVLCIPSILSKIFAKFFSTTTATTPRIGRLSRQMSLKDEQERLLSDRQCNKRVKINACGKLYEDLVKTKPDLYGCAPGGKGIDFEVQYYDSSNRLSSVGADKPSKSRPPVVCLLHGAPGHYFEFASLINQLTSKGCRVIALNFPDYSATFDYSFRHSPKERSDYLLRFFEAIKVDRLDMLIGHSTAIYTIFELLNQTRTGVQTKRLLIDSLGLFSTPSYNLPNNLAVTPSRMFMLKLFDYPYLRPILVLTLSAFMRIQGIKNRLDKDRIDNILIAASAMGFSEPEKLPHYIKLVHEHSIPTFLAFGTQDRLIPVDCFNHLKQDLGIKNDGQVKVYNQDGSVRQDPIELSKLAEVSQFEGGGHYAFQRYSNQVADDVYAFLRRRIFRKKEWDEATLVTKL